MFLQFREVVEGIDTVQFAGVDEAHEQIAHLGAILGLVEQRVLSMQNRSFQGAKQTVASSGRPSHARLLEGHDLIVPLSALDLVYRFRGDVLSGAFARVLCLLRTGGVPFPCSGGSRQSGWWKGHSWPGN